MLAAATPAQAFHTEAHKIITERALRGKIPIGTVPNPSEASLVKFYQWLGRSMAQASGDQRLDGYDPERFTQRFPSPRSFDAFAIRGLLGFNQERDHSVFGLEDFDRGVVIERFGIVIDGATRPDLDKRNQDRLAYDDKRKPLNLPDGTRVPIDPMGLNFGTVTGLSSQAIAHYQLSAEHPSKDASVLESEPWNFVVDFGFPTDKVQSYGAAMAQLHLDMAILAKYWGLEQMDSTGEYLSLVWLGAGLHYIEDSAWPLHNVQVGSYALFRRAKLTNWLEQLRTGGGTWGTVRTFVSIGQEFLSNHHLLAEAWQLDQLERARDNKQPHAAMAKAWAQADQDDAELATALGDKLKPYLSGPLTQQPWQDGAGAGTILAETLAKLGSRQGGALYDATAQAASPLLRQPGFSVAEKDGLKPALLGDSKDNSVQEALDKMAEIDAGSLRRANMAARLYLQAFEQGSPDAAARRLRRTRLDQLELEEKRRADFVQHPPVVTKGPAGIEPKDPRWLYGEIGAGLLMMTALGWLLRRRFRARVRTS